ncbi:MAG: glycoside hydrolase family 2 protein [Planctomycetaceae bacterium]
MRRYSAKNALRWTLFWTVACVSQAASHGFESRRPAVVNLNGDWQFSIHGRAKRPMPVPSTFLPVGGATLERTFQPPRLAAGERLLLKFDGIIMTGEVFVNDASLGRFGPYTPFSIDITSRVRPGENTLRVEITDLDGFGAWGRGWVTAFPRFGGIMRDVSLETRPAVSIENARLDYDLSQLNGAPRAECRLKVWVANTTREARSIALRAAVARGGESTRSAANVRVEPGQSTHELKFALDRVALWSPDNPQIYDLSVDLDDQGRTDRFAAITGFKQLRTQGRDFFLNGEKFFLKGIFRHDIYGEQGHTLTRQQMERELADIKSLGCNFLRLGHYPQHAYISELAARLGLIISGEPPVFGMDQKNPDSVAAAKFCLGGLIERDWNNPAVGFWIIANESGTDPGYMQQLSEFVRGLDPQRLVTIVDNTKLTAANLPWDAFRKARIDFICQNAYGAAFNGYYASLERLLPDDMPFVISEWGGTVNAYADVLREGRYYLDHSSLVRSDGPRIAGISFWEYQDILLPRWTEEGILHWSLVDQERRPYETYYALKSLYTGKEVLPPRGRLLVPNMPEDLPRPLAPQPMERHAGYEMLDLSAAINSDKVLGALEPVAPLAWPQTLAMGEVVVAGLPFRLHRELVALTKAQPAVEISVGRKASEIIFLGHVCYNTPATRPAASPPELPFLTEVFLGIDAGSRFKGYPLGGKFGDKIGEYVLTYADGERETIPLENGVHFADYRLYSGFSFIDAIATDTERALKYKGDFGVKAYQTRLFSYRPRRPGQPIRTLTFRLLADDYVPLLAAVTVHVKP